MGKYIFEILQSYSKLHTGQTKYIYCMQVSLWLQFQEVDLLRSNTVLLFHVSLAYSQTKWSIPLNITLMNWLFEYWSCKSFQECNNELNIAKLNSQVVPRIQLMGLMFWKINLILIFEMTGTLKMYFF